MPKQFTKDEIIKRIYDIHGDTIVLAPNQELKRFSDTMWFEGNKLKALGVL